MKIFRGDNMNFKRNVSLSEKAGDSKPSGKYVSLERHVREL